MPRLLEKTKGFVAREVGSRKRARTHGLLVIPCSAHESTNYALLTKPGNIAYVNGQRVIGGLCVLKHKDEITIGARRYFFSAESTPEVTVYRQETAARVVRCGICRGPVLDGQQVVRCPGCQRVYHQIAAEGDQPAKPCWTYSPTCKFCGHGTSLDNDALWQPEEDEMECHDECY